MTLRLTEISATHAISERVSRSAARSPTALVGSPTYWVATDGDDTGSGSEDDPWATLQHAADSAAPGVAVYVREGDYPQRGEFHVSGEAGRGLQSHGPAIGAALGGGYPRVQTSAIRESMAHRVNVRGLAGPPARRSRAPGEGGWGGRSRRPTPGARPN